MYKQASPISFELTSFQTVKSRNKAPGTNGLRVHVLVSTDTDGSYSKRLDVKLFLFNELLVHQWITPTQQVQLVQSNTVEVHAAYRHSPMPLNASVYVSNIFISTTFLTLTENRKPVAFKPQYFKHLHQLHPDRLHRSCHPHHLETETANTIYFKV